MCDECGCGMPASPPGGSAAPPEGGRRTLEIRKKVLAANDALANENRRWLLRRSAAMVNLISSPGAGKTTLLVKTLQEIGRLRGRALAVIEGDQQTDNDARRIAATGVCVAQINTGSSCHLDAHQVGHALEDLDPPPGALVIVENVGNLICPAGFDLGQTADVTLLSVAEGDDKPEKYPAAFRRADAVVLSKLDLLPHVDFDPHRAEGLARALNTGLRWLPLSARTGEGVDAWVQWLLGLEPQAGPPEVARAVVGVGEEP